MACITLFDKILLPCLRISLFELNCFVFIEFSELNCVTRDNNFLNICLALITP